MNFFAPQLPLDQPRVADVLDEQGAHALLPDLPDQPGHSSRRGLTVRAPTLRRQEVHAVGSAEVAKMFKKKKRGALILALFGRRRRRRLQLEL